MTLEKELIDRKKRGYYRKHTLLSKLIDFASNDYLGLAGSQKLEEWVFREYSVHGKERIFGSTGSPLLTGHSRYREELAKIVADFHGVETATLFNCGYMANIGIVTAVARKEDTLFFDADVHVSMKEGIRLIEAKAFPFRHNDLHHLENRLKGSSAKGFRYILIESIYSTDGSIAPLRELFHLAEQYHARVIVDEAHAIGVWGEEGRGVAHAEGLIPFAQVAAYGKGLGAQGAAILGSFGLQEALINFAKPYIYSTALPFIALAAIKGSYVLFPAMEQERKNLRSLVDSCKQRGFSSPTHIQPYYISGADVVAAKARLLQEKGFDVRPVVSPTVRRGKECLRISLHAFNTPAELNSLIEELA